MEANAAARAISQAIEEGLEYAEPLTDPFTHLELQTTDGWAVQIDSVAAELTNTPETSSFLVHLNSGEDYRVTVEKVHPKRLPNGTDVIVTNSKSGKNTHGKIVGANEDGAKVWWYYIEKSDGTQIEALPSIVRAV